MTDAENSPEPASASTVNQVSEENGPNPMPEIDPALEANNAPASPAMKADTQNTSTRVIRTLVPCMASALGESAMTWHNRPRRERLSRYIPTATASTTPRAT